VMLGAFDDHGEVSVHVGHSVSYDTVVCVSFHHIGHHDWFDVIVHVAADAVLLGLCGEGANHQQEGQE